MFANVLRPTLFGQVSRLWLPASALMLMVTPAHAAIRKADEARIAGCIHGAAAGRPWLEKTLWGLRDQEAGWIGAEVRNTNGTHDLGPLQINTWWVPRIAALVGRPAPEVRHWLRFDACFNVEAARWIFLAALSDTGDFWKAVGVYHSPTGWRQRRYALNVAKRLKRRFGESAFAPVLSAP
ncbi:lytic transglycosylase domain-containing protein [Novosphingobium sp. PY1]|uniref:lytic transglycosylase domain-containing protein n=1 Tax=Novosphingobium sp. PY1 TaxID=1882221 RepID=UPI000BE78C3F|nr:lytic transglycosylase domain-containing protein [Novosphingobium sp. PY1]BBA74065.1 lytic transglycosylase catalytic subunit [Novosphingobium sp. PY1]GFM31302.1 lytic transglycosylase catalytic subunit [Novosphingobium sp. PY1]